MFDVRKDERLRLVQLKAQYAGARVMIPLVIYSLSVAELSGEAIPTVVTIILVVSIWIGLAVTVVKLRREGWYSSVKEARTDLDRSRDRLMAMLAFCFCLLMETARYTVPEIQNRDGFWVRMLSLSISLQCATWIARARWKRAVAAQELRDSAA